MKNLNTFTEFGIFHSFITGWPGQHWILLTSYEQSIVIFQEFGLLMIFIHSLMFCLVET